mmetsp:Transcript_13549/g.26993  ORF Transcript_13549/g.26993 Transcript_13549/m.26993 type:complete len:290 (-) Transcript_13549:117-986(-)
MSRQIISISITLLLSQICNFSCAFSPSMISRERVNLFTRSTTLDSSTSSVVTKESEVTDPRMEGLALMLDDGTRKSHSIAENSAFLTGLLKGISTQDAYCNLLTSFYYVYKNMEGAFDECEMDQVQILDDNKLRRIEGLCVDMDYFYGKDWKADISPSPFTQKYIARIQEVAKEKPYLLIAHQYTRYLGDLFGGQMIAGMTSRSLNLNDGDGTAFYKFDEIDSTKDYITDWYTKMNNLDLSEEQKKEIVDEANLVFEYNIGIFQELEGSPFKAMWSLVLSNLRDTFGRR